MPEVVVSGISSGFPELSRCDGQITHVLLTRSPLEYPRRGLSARLACVKHAASVRPEPGSNSPRTGCEIGLHHHEGGFDGRSLTMKESLWPGQAPTRSQRPAHPSRTARRRPRRMADRFPLPAETGADEPDVDRPQPPVEAGSIAKLLSFQRPRALRARPRSLANRLAKHKSGASARRRTYGATRANRRPTRSSAPAIRER